MTNEGARILFLGSPDFAVPALNALVNGGHILVGAVTQPDRPSGRGGRLVKPPVKVRGEELGIPVIQPESLRDAAVVDRLAALRPELLVVAAYGKILPKAVLAIPPRGALNVHASLLPRWRGASPIAAAIRAGDAITGVTIMCIEPKMDAGPILASRSTPIGPNETAGGLESRLAVIGADLLVSAIAGWLEGSLSGQPQDEAAATYCRVLAKEDGLLTSAMTAAEAERAVRAFDPWPGAYVNYRGERLAIWRGQVLAVQAPAGNLTIRNGLPAIGFGEQSLCLLEVQRAGGRRLAGSDFVNGQRGRLEPVVGLG